MLRSLINLKRKLAKVWGDARLVMARSISVNEQLATVNLELRAIAESEYGSDCLSSSFTVAEEPTTVYDVDADAAEESVKKLASEDFSHRLSSSSSFSNPSYYQEAPYGMLLI